MNKPIYIKPGARVVTSTSPHDWTEDFDHENGQYQNTCCHCNTKLIGHKRRVTCKVCAK